MFDKCCVKWIIRGKSEKCFVFTASAIICEALQQNHISNPLIQLCSCTEHILCFYSELSFYWFLSVGLCSTLHTKTDPEVSQISASIMHSPWPIMQVSVALSDLTNFIQAGGLVPAEHLNIFQSFLMRRVFPWLPFCFRSVLNHIILKCQGKTENDSSESSHPLKL